MAYPLMRRASCPSRLLSSVCKVLTPLVPKVSRTRVYPGPVPRRDDLLPACARRDHAGAGIRTPAGRRLSPRPGQAHLHPRQGCGSRRAVPAGLDALNTGAGARAPGRRHEPQRLGGDVACAREVRQSSRIPSGFPVVMEKFLTLRGNTRVYAPRHPSGGPYLRAVSSATCRAKAT